MKNRAFDLFLLATGLAQLKDQARVVSFFMEGMGAIFPELAFAWVLRDEPGECERVEVCTRQETFGFVCYRGEDKVEETTQALIYNASQMLGVILEKLKQEHVLVEQNRALESLAGERAQLLGELEQRVSARTQDLEKANQALAAAHRAALKSMAEAVDARQQAEQIADELRHEVEERKQADRELKESEERWRRAIADSPIPIMIHDEQDQILQLSAGWTKYSGYTIEDIPTMADWTEKAYGERSGLKKEYIDHLFTIDQTVQNGEWIVTARDGSKRVWDFQTTPLGSMHGHQRVLHSMAIDITEQKEANAALRESRALLQAAMDHSPAGIAIADAPDGRLRYVNDAGLLIRGGDRQSIVDGVGIEQYVASWQTLDLDGRPLKTDEVPLARAIRYGEACGREFIVRRDNQDDRIVFANAAPIHDETGKLTAAIVVFTDISERKKAEVELLQYRDHLQDLIKERTNELEIAKEKAESANQAKSAFLATMSHEIRTPLNGVLGLTSLALQTNLSPKQRDYLDKIQLSGESLLAMINDILDFSKIEAGKFTLERENFNLDHLIQSISNIAALKAQEKRLELVFYTSPDVPGLLVGDALRLGQVLTNLVGNAIKFTHSGDVVVKISLVDQSARHATLEFSVQDTGIGLSPTQADELFRPFSQADSSISRKYGGTGLGLTISQRLVSMMGGEITVHSQAGQGSLFRFTLTFERQSGSARANLAPDPALSGLRVLVLAEHPQTLEFLQKTLESFSLRVTASPSVLNGLAYFEPDQGGRSFDLLLIDAHLADEIGGLAQLAQIPMILLGTAQTVPQGDVAGQPGRMLVKPVTRSQLFDAIMQTFGRQVTERHAPDTKTAVSGIPGQLQGRRALLVEDNEINQLVAVELLENLGLKVAVAGNGEDAVRMVQAGNFEVVLMDIQMPGMDGYQTTAQIRSDPRFGYSSLPIIAMTAHALIGDREKTLVAGLNDYVSKPVNVAHLTNVLLRWLSPQPSPVMADEANEPAPQSMPDRSSCLNVEKALQRLDNNHPLYLRLLRLFREKHSGAVVEMRAALLAGDMELAHRLIHTLKGVAGTIGADELAEFSRGLEAAILANNSALVAAELDRAQELLGTVQKAIDGMLED